MSRLRSAAMNQASRSSRMWLQGDVEHTYKGAAKHIGVVLEDRAGGRKHITRITAMEAFAIDPDELATALQRRFQANARCAACSINIPIEGP